MHHFLTVLATDSLCKVAVLDSSKEIGSVCSVAKVDAVMVTSDCFADLDMNVFAPTHFTVVALSDGKEFDYDPGRVQQRFAAAMVFFASHAPKDTRFWVSGSWNNYVATTRVEAMLGTRKGVSIVAPQQAPEEKKQEFYHEVRVDRESKDSEDDFMVTVTDKVHHCLTCFFAVFSPVRGD